MKRPLKVIVVGGGVAGMSFALRLIDLMGRGEVDIRLISKAPVETSNSHAAQGGVAAVIHPGDSWEQHRDDTIAVGAGRCDVEVVERVVREGPACIQELMDIGARFDKDPQGRLDAASEGGHHAPRVVHHSDHTGAEIVRVLQHKVRNAQDISITETLVALDLLIAEDHRGRRCHGVRTVDIHSHQVREAQIFRRVDEKTCYTVHAAAPNPLAWVNGLPFLILCLNGTGLSLRLRYTNSVGVHRRGRKGLQVQWLTTD